MSQHPLALIILDGWGHREDKNANAIALAHTPNWKYLWSQCPHTLISGCGRCVGLPDGQMGNSEVGHLNMGAGRIVHQDLTRIDLAIENGDFFTNPVLLEGINKAVRHNKAVHIIGLLSPGGVHSHEKHFHALIKLAAKKGANTYIHAFLDGRDTPPRSAEGSLKNLMQICRELKNGKILSIIGRYYAMDRDKRWERIEKAYELLANDKADYTAPDALRALEMAYDRSETDEFVKPTRIQEDDTQPIRMEEGDIVIFMNFRADRARELTRAFIDSDFNGFKRSRQPALGDFISLTEYDSHCKTSVAFQPEKLDNILGDYLSKQGLTQLRLAETEKYAHVTFFFNGGIEEAFPGEERILIPSPKVATYDLKPEMSAHEVTDQLVSAIISRKYDVIICNFANPDMIGHTGNLPATIEAIEVIDRCLGRIITALQEVQGEAIFTADHGNAEIMFDETNDQPHTAHTHELVPFIYYGKPAVITKEHGKLSDIAPTMLYLLGLSQPNEMTGSTLLEFN